MIDEQIRQAQEAYEIKKAQNAMASSTEEDIEEEVENEVVELVHLESAPKKVASLLDAFYVVKRDFNILSTIEKKLKKIIFAELNKQKVNFLSYGKYVVLEKKVPRIQYPGAELEKYVSSDLSNEFKTIKETPYLNCIIRDHASDNEFVKRALSLNLLKIDTPSEDILEFFSELRKELNGLRKRVNMLSSAIKTMMLSENKKDIVYESMTLSLFVRKLPVYDQKKIMEKVPAEILAKVRTEKTTSTLYVEPAT
jgi:hypothetical protein